MSKKILLVADDVEMSRKVIRKFMSAEFDVLEAEDGLQALELLENNHVDAMLLDIIMPKMDGLQVLERVRGTERWKNIGVLVASSTKEKTERTALSLGADDIVSKPYDPVVIQKRLENILIAKNSRANRENAEKGGERQDGQLRAIAAKAEELSDALHSIADIVKGNQDNPQLLTEAAEQLHRKAAQLSKLFAES